LSPILLAVHSGTFFLWCTEAFQFEAIPFVNSCLFLEQLEFYSESCCLYLHLQVFSLYFPLIVSKFQDLH
jgi:hypothetical protein